MPSIKIESKCSHPVEEAFNRVKELLSDDPGLRKLDSSYSCTFDESQKKGEAKGQQFTAKMQVTPAGAGSSVEITVDIPFLLTPFKGQIKSTLEKKLGSALS